MKDEKKFKAVKKRYTHQTYGLGVVIAKDLLDARYNKKPWVPQWLFNWFTTPDLLDLLDRKMRAK